MDTNKKQVVRDDLLLKDEVYAIIGAAMEVHNDLGAGFLEAVYQEAMEIELGIRSIAFQPQCPLKIMYKSRVLEKAYCADLFCYGQIVVEVKAMKELTGREEALELPQGDRPARRAPHQLR